MSEDRISFPAPEKNSVNHGPVEFAKLTLDVYSSTFHFEHGSESQLESFGDMLSLLNYFGSKGWYVAFKEQNDTIYLQRPRGGK